MTHPTLVIFSSSRAKGNTFKFLQQLKQVHDFELLKLESLNIHPYCYQHQHSNDDFFNVVQKMTNAERIIFASPVYWYSVPPAMKTFVDRMTDLLEVRNWKPIGKKLREKKFMLIATSVKQQLSQTYLQQWQQTLLYFGYTFGGYMHLNCNQGYNPQKAEQAISQFLSRLKQR